MAELVYARALEARPARVRGSSPLRSTLRQANCKQKTALNAVFKFKLVKRGNKLFVDPGPLA